MNSDFYRVDTGSIVRCTNKECIYFTKGEEYLVKYPHTLDYDKDEVVFLEDDDTDLHAVTYEFFKANFELVRL